MKLVSLQPEGIRLVTPELANGSLDRWDESIWKPLVIEIERPVGLEALDASLDELLATVPRHETAIDSWLAPRLHDVLPLTRRQAAEAGIWRFLAVVYRPDVVRHRWENLAWANTRSRFWSPGTRHTSNLFARLWWIAEITRDRSDYSLTERVLARQTLATRIFVRTWSQHRPAVEGFVEVFENATAERAEAGARTLSRYLATVPLEGLSAADIAGVLRSWQPL